MKNNKGEVMEVILILMIVFLIVVGIVTAFLQPSMEAKIYNQKFGTSYSMWDFMFAGNTIKSYVNQGEQKTFNIKGLELIKPTLD